MAFHKPNYTYRAIILRVIDGDTIDVSLDLGCHITVYKRLRLLDLDTDEMRGGTPETKLRARAAKARIAELLKMGRVFVSTKMDAKGKYGRLLARMYVESSTLNESADHPVIIDINKTMIDEGYQKGNTGDFTPLY